MNRRTVTIAAAVLLAGLALAPVFGAVQRPENPADVQVRVAPDSVPPGGEVEVTVRVVPEGAIKINRYPKVTLKVAEVEDLVAAAETFVGDAERPPEEKMKGNYFKSVEPLTLTLALSDRAAPGDHEIKAKLRYTFCLKSDACFMERVTLKIPVTVR